jgi:hypothetical protein
MRTYFIALTLVLFLPVAAWAQDKANQLADALLINDLTAVMREEGFKSGQEVADAMLGGPSAGWTAILSQVYETDRMSALFRAAFAQALEGEDIDAMLTFFQSPQGQEIVTLELAARRAYLDEAVEEASKAILQNPSAAQQRRLALIEEFDANNSLIDANVVGALNANLAFYQGLDQGGVFNGAMTEDRMLSEVWEQEAEIRQNTTEWLYSYLLLAYEPLSDADFEAYIAFSDTPVGQAMNDALFEAFDVLFVDISLTLGLAVAEITKGQDI